MVFTISFSPQDQTRGIATSSVGSPQAPLFQNSVSINTPADDSATKVSLSSRATPFERSSTQAARAISDATSVVSIAAGAADEIERLIGNLESVQAQLDTLLTPTQQTALESEADSLLEEINTVAEEATFNGQSVVNSGAQTIEFDLDVADENSSTAVAIQIPNVAVDSESLGINTLTGAGITADPESAKTTLTAAKAQVRAVQSSLESSESQINGAAERAGLTAQIESDNASRLTERDASAFAERIASSLGSLVTDAQADLIDPIRVQDLITLPEEGAQSSATAEGEEDDDENETLFATT